MILIWGNVGITYVENRINVRCQEYSEQQAFIAGSELKLLPGTNSTLGTSLWLSSWAIKIHGFLAECYKLRLLNCQGLFPQRSRIIEYALGSKYESLWAIKNIECSFLLRDRVKVFDKYKTATLSLSSGKIAFFRLYPKYETGLILHLFLLENTKCYNNGHWQLISKPIILIYVR